MFGFFSNRENKYSEEDWEDEENNNHSEDDLEQHFLDDNIINVNGDETGYTTWITKLSPSGVKYLQPWELNRDVDEEFVQSITSEQEDFYKKYQRYNFIVPIHLCKNEDGSYEVIDGQHRISGYNRLIHQNDLPCLPVVIHFVKNELEKRQLFKFLNKRVIVNDEQLYQDKIYEILIKLDEKWKSEFEIRKIRNGYPRNLTLKSIFGGGDNRANIPYIFKNKFSRDLRKTKIITKSVEDIIGKIFEINSKLGLLPRNQRCSRRINDKIHQSAENFNLYLGYDKEMKWMKDLDL